MELVYTLIIDSVVSGTKLGLVTGLSAYLTFYVVYSLL